MWTSPPISRTLRAHACHICPGPSRGYRYSLMSDLRSVERRLTEAAAKIARYNESPLIRCAAYSARISVQSRPQTLSV
jgi:hypothetical protein